MIWVTTRRHDLPHVRRVWLTSMPMPSRLRPGSARPLSAVAVLATVLSTLLALVATLVVASVPAGATPSAEPVPAGAEPTSAEPTGSTSPTPAPDPTTPAQDPTETSAPESDEPSEDSAEQAGQEADEQAEEAGESATKAGNEKGAARKKKHKFWMHLATYNVLGSQHTRGRGGYGPGVKRARMTAREFKKRGLDVIGMQEVQRDQYHVFRKNLPNHRIWPGTSLGNQGIRLQIAWRKSQFKLVKTGTIMTRFHRQTRPIPWVKLKNRSTGKRMYVVNIHNSPNNLERERDSATRKEIALIRRLRSHGNPVFVTGDMNEKQEFYCKVTRRTDLNAANGGRSEAKRCQPPRRRLRVDWIMGGRKVHFSAYREDRGGNLRRTSDHRLIHTKVRVGPRTKNG